MRQFQHSIVCAVLTAASVFFVFPARADEGMWTFHSFPTEVLKQKYQTTASAAWLDHVRLSTVRLQNCTASFVSASGLLLTNHHCSAPCLDEHSTAGRNLLKDGYLAKGRDQELRCPTQIADVLIGVEDVTATVNAATKGQSDQAANETRKKTLTQLEQACEQKSDRSSKTGPLKCEAVNLYEGGQQYLYKYKRYDDVRLVFAPEQGIAAFGGDPDNFQFPRWCLDMSVLRAYDANGRPAATPNFLKFNFSGPAPGDLVFVSGHPGTTNRLLTAAQLDTQRSIDLPQALLRASELRGRYIQYSKTGMEADRIVQDPLNSLQNGIKVRRKLLDALLDDTLLAHKRAEEADLRAKTQADAGLAAEIGDPWKDIAAAQEIDHALSLPYTYLEAAAGFNSRLFRYARSLVRGTAEVAKPNSDRLRDYRDTALPRLEQTLGAAVPVYADLEKLTLSFSLERMREWLGPDNPVIGKLLTTDSPDSLAGRVVNGSKLADPAVRMQLWKGGAQAVNESNDPMIELARLVDAPARAVRKRYEDEVEAVERASSEKIARARFAAYGTGLAPDATFTLRLNFGTVQGWKEKGEMIEPLTLLSRLFERATGRAPFEVPASWVKAKDRLDMNTKFNLSTNNDIVGGNSGSPLIDVRGDIVGLMFDGNIHSISGSYWFDPQKNRAIAVHPAIIREALVKVYGANALLRELERKN
jgi:hypothetical protein